MNCARVSRMFAALTVVVMLAVGAQAQQLVGVRGSDQTFDIATWNIQQFPKEDNQTIDAVHQMIIDMDIELLGVQEITNSTDFETLVDGLDGWGGQVGPNHSGLRAGVIYNEHKVNVQRYYEIFTSDSYAFPRAPFVLPVEMHENNDVLEFRIIVVHLKAGRNDSDSRDRREAACDSLKAYMDRKLDAGVQTKWMVVGDFNDDLDDSYYQNVFNKFLDDDRYTFITQPLVGGSGSWIPAGFFYDHILVTSDLYAEFTDAGRTEILPVDSEYSQYEDIVSDHRPVAAYFPAIDTSVDESVAALPVATTMSVWPMPSNAQVSVSYQLAKSNCGTMRIFDMMGREVYASAVSSGAGVVTWDANNVATGTYLVRITGETGETAAKRAIILK